jgi:hypothetical protein
VPEAVAAGARELALLLPLRPLFRLGPPPGQPHHGVNGVGEYVRRLGLAAQLSRVSLSRERPYPGARAVRWGNLARLLASAARNGGGRLPLLQPDLSVHALRVPHEAALISGESLRGEKWMAHDDFPSVAANTEGDAATPPGLSPREAAAQARIAELRMRLLDLTNSNRLLNYKFSDRSRRQVRLVDELPDELIGRLEDGKRLAFRPLPELGDQPQDERDDDTFLLALEQAKRSDEEYLAALDTLGNDEEGEGARRAERALRDHLRKALGMPDRLLRDPISKAAWARQNNIEPSFDLPVSA